MINKETKDINPSFVPPLIALIASLLIPGLGHILSRRIRRGLLLVFATGTILGLSVWRFKAVARFDKTPIDIFLKALRLESIMILIVALIVILYVWIARDAYITAGGKRGSGTSLLIFVLVVYFTLGWQISDINLVKLVTGVNRATPAFLRVLWPWEHAITYPEEFISGQANILVPCTDEPLAPTEPTEGEPYLVSNPTCGDLTTVEGMQGTEIHLEGYNFIPEKEAIIWWQDPNRQTFRHRVAGDFLRLIPDENGYFEADIILPYRLIGPSASDEAMIWIVSARQVSNILSPVPSEALVTSAELIIETIFMGMMATFFGIIFAVPVSFFAARNLMGNTSITLVIYYIVRGILNIVRSIEPMIWAIIAMIAVGLGPYAGIVALTLHSVAALGKLYSESIESIDSGPIEAVQATGANWLQTVVFAVIPQIVPPFVSFTIYRWDINVRMSTVIGLVGGGGIGFVLIQWIRVTDYDSAGIAVWFIAITVAILDYVSAEIRARFV